MTQTKIKKAVKRLWIRPIDVHSTFTASTPAVIHHDSKSMTYAQSQSEGVKN